MNSIDAGLLNLLKGRTHSPFQPVPPAPRAGTITDAQADHLLQLICEYGGLIRQECDFRHAAGDTRYGAHIENAKHARDLQGTYYAEIRSILKGFTK